MKKSLDYLERPVVCAGDDFQAGGDAAQLNKVVNGLPSRPERQQLKHGLNVVLYSRQLLNMAGFFYYVAL